MKTDYLLQKIFVSFLFLSLGTFWNGPVTVVAGEKPEKPLYECLGGIYVISSIVDSFIELLVVNDVLNANPEIREARDPKAKAGLKFQITRQLCEGTGGPCKYTGKTMRESHAYLKITEMEWEAMLSDLQRVLNNHLVPAREQKELIGIVENTKKDIVTTEAEMK
jgi:hemoglobin